MYRPGKDCNTVLNQLEFLLGTVPNFEPSMDHDTCVMRRGCHYCIIRVLTVLVREANQLEVR
jgi:hypothetical protein